MATTTSGVGLKLLSTRGIARIIKLFALKVKFKPKSHITQRSKNVSTRNYAKKATNRTAKKNLKQGYDNESIANSTKNALEVEKNELKELERMQKEYDLGIFDIYQYKYQELLSYLLRQIRLGGRIFDNTQQKNDFIKKTMAQWEKENAGLKQLMFLKRAFLCPPPQAKTYPPKKCLKA